MTQRDSKIARAGVVKRHVNRGAFYLLLLLVVSTSRFVLAQQGATIQNVPKSTPFAKASPRTAATPCNKIYNIGGFSDGGLTNTTRIYCTCTETWSTGAPCPAALSGFAIGIYDGVIYLAGGFDGLSAVNTLYEYFPPDLWAMGAPMPAAVHSAGFGIINAKLYVASGNNGTGEVNTLYIYDIPSNTWSTGAPVPVPVTAPGSAVLNGRLYLFGGGAPFPMTTSTTQVYDPVTNSWSICADMNMPRLWFYGAAVDDTTIVAPGGDNPVGTPINDNEQGACGWATRAPMPYDARGPFAVSDGTFVYVGGGYDGTNARSDLLRYDPIADTWATLAPSGDGHYLSPAVVGFAFGNPPCGTPTPTPSEPPGTPTATPTFTPTPTMPPPSPTATATFTPTITPQPSPSPTIIDSPTPTPTFTPTRVSPTPRLRPSPAPRP